MENKSGFRNGGAIASKTHRMLYEETAFFSSFLLTSYGFKYILDGTFLKFGRKKKRTLRSQKHAYPGFLFCFGYCNKKKVSCEDGVLNLSFGIPWWSVAIPPPPFMYSPCSLNSLWKTNCKSYFWKKLYEQVELWIYAQLLVLSLWKLNSFMD